MTLSSSMNAGIMGLSVNATRLGTVADNIANSDTYGYKRSVTDFSSMVIKSNSNAYAAGGVRVDAYRQVDEQGALISTGNSTDIAIGGKGLLPVTNEAGTDAQNTNPDLMLVATGSFSPDQNGYLRTESGLFLMGWPVDPVTGSIGAVTRQGGASLEPVRVDVTQFESTPTSNIRMGINLPADATNPGGPTTPYEIAVEYFDNFGRVQTMTARFTPDTSGGAASNRWNVELLDNSSGTPTSVSDFDVTFQDSTTNGGSIGGAFTPGTATAFPGYNSTTGEVTVTLAGGNTVDVFIGAPNDRSGLTQFAAEFAPYNLTKDGAAIGDLLSIEIDALGNLQAIYDTGFRQDLYQIPVAEVPNPNGLVATNDQAFQLSQSSGDVYFWDAGSGPVGETVGFALMESTTDIASELTQLIETQRAYSSNAKIIQTVDEMLQETNNIIR
ncbi:MAG: flagellar hook-basal body complex protein [Pseudomonadota bacterium]